MTHRTNARIAGLLFLLYIVTGIASMMLFGRATGGAKDPATTLTNLAAHETLARCNILLGLLMFVYAVGLGVTLYALTRDEDRDLALFAMCCRLSEGIVGVVSITGTLSLLSLASASAGTEAQEAAAARALGGLLLKEGGWTGSIAAACFSMGSTIFAYLFLRARSIPVWLAWLGVVSSAILVALIPLQLAGFLKGPLVYAMWGPIAVFEIVLAFWLIVKGVRPRAKPLSAV